ncbi:MAG TPA: hypothetical protein P5081_12375 [Phycisphaerae bacterium]|nr:hypothetical protein [Phycisphaerae bacterium]HRW53672.1 hypothetical protein [Phycisphaerae bacterium]
MTRSTRRKIKLAGYLTAGAMLLQFGQACAVVSSVATAGVSSSGFLIDNNGYFLGLFNVCGAENIQIVDENGIQQGDIVNSGDDLMFGCPARQVVQTGG